MKSSMFSLQTRDFIKGAILAVLVPVFVIVQQSLSEGSLVFDWKAIAIAALSAFLAYIAKNFFSDDVKAAHNVIAKAKEEEIKTGEETERKL